MSTFGAHGSIWPPVYPMTFRYQITKIESSEAGYYTHPTYLSWRVTRAESRRTWLGFKVKDLSLWQNHLPGPIMEVFGELGKNIRGEVRNRSK